MKSVKIKSDIDSQVLALQKKLEFAKGEIKAIETQLDYLENVSASIEQGAYNEE